MGTLRCRTRQPWLATPLCTISPATISLSLAFAALVVADSNARIPGLFLARNPTADLSFPSPDPQSECKDGLDKSGIRGMLYAVVPRPDAVELACHACLRAFRRFSAPLEIHDPLNNKSGQSPCAVKAQLEKACSANSSNYGECTCNTVMYNVCAACAVCEGENIPSWEDWADENDCGSNPLQFPSHVTLEQNTIPGWAYQQLSNTHDFDLQAAISASSNPGPSKSALAAQIAVPIAAGVGVALIAILLFYLYQRRKWRRHQHPRDRRTKTLPQIQGSRSAFWRPSRVFYTYWPSARSRRLRPSKKDSDWAIEDDEDEDTRWLGHGSRGSRGHSVHLNASYVDPYALTQEPEPLDPDADLPHTSAHIPETSSSSLLSRPGDTQVHVTTPPVCAPTIVERIVNIVLPGRDGLQKSPTYKLKHVSPVSADPQFRIDGSAGPTPVAKAFASAAGRSSRASVSARGDPDAVGGAGLSGSASAKGSVQRDVGIVQGATERSDFRPQRRDTVLLISRDGRDFSLDDTMTTAPSPTRTNVPESPSTFPPVSLVCTRSSPPRC
ncbi:hypothetical protein BN946_scf184980.g52 [Trametes cinnabarina]|uniref:Uncharacterized protein n=1 Tax=Pycnoporus cinnabarinus TaxID=5643 RepID=A0A060SE69_PYCCI|nr:hypothetical protein BN946_scf184980.g52 [Trametes cinnabarina]